jgi:molybdopterin/thiamine biosynthesis adenylyltransferase
MTELSERYDRNMRLFGAAGQAKLRATTATIVGVGGLGSPLSQHLALFGVGRLNLVDDEELDNTNRNRFVGCRHNDPVPGSLKVSLTERYVRETNPDVEVNAFSSQLVSDDGFAAVKSADVVFGCFDEDGPRAILNELCAAYGKHYIDLASDVPEPGIYGGRVCVAWDGNGCLSCMGELDGRAVQRYLQTDVQREVEAKIYGIDKTLLANKGPSVSPLNGVIASLGAMEFMVGITGMRMPFRLLNYRGHLGTVSVRKDPTSGCFICKGIRDQGNQADVERYLRLTHLRERRISR